MNIVVVAEYTEMSRRAADFVAERVTRQPNLRIGLPTGNTPRGMYDNLVQKYKAGDLDFSKVSTFNLDEYWGIDPDHPASFARYIKEQFLRHVNVSPEGTHWPSGMGNPRQNSEAYEKLVGNPGLDLVILGIGGNGHIGFNEPGASFDARTGLVQLAARTRRDAFHPRSGFSAPEDVPTHGITMGIGTIMGADSILLLASGTSKSEAIARALQGPVTEDVPASVLQRHADVTVIIDEAAGEGLVNS